MQLFVAKCSQVLLLCRCLPLASRCPQFGVLYLGVPEDWGVHGHKMFPLWRILCRLRHFVARGDVFMAANPTAASPRNFGDTLLAELNSDQSDQGKDGFQARQKLFPTLTANASILSKLTQMHQLIQITGTARHKDLLQIFSDFYNKLPA